MIGEQLLHYCWKHKLFPLKELETTDGQPVEVIDTGLHNTDAGPDFFNAKVKIGDTLWAGNVEIHRRSADWYVHRHEQDAHYDNVILHIAAVIDTEIKTRSGQFVPQMQMDVPADVAQHYGELLTTDAYPPCYKIIPCLSQLTIHSWMSALQTERLEQKTQAIGERADRCNGSWADVYFQTLARNYGFGVNGDAFETWARHVPLHIASHHRDSLFQIEALFLGQAGLLDPKSVPERNREAALKDAYFNRLRTEYQYLAHKFGIRSMAAEQWKFLRLRPQNFPHIRIAQLARLYCSRRAGLSELLECTTVEQIETLFDTAVTPYWETHYGFGPAGERREKRLSQASRRLLIINTVVPMLFAYGRYKSSEALCDRALALWEQLPAENNHIVRMWRDCGLTVGTAADSQALIQLKRAYCDRKDCLRCRIGFEYLCRKSRKVKG